MKSLRFVCCFSLFVLAAFLIVLVAAQSNPVVHAGQAPGVNNSLFFPVVPYNAGGKLGWSLAVADLNGDGKPDVVFASATGEPNGDGVIGVLLGNGDGTFQPAVAYDAGCGALSVVIGDLNGDGIPDVVVASPGCVSVLLGKGDGTFQSGVAYSSGGGSGASGEGIFSPILIADVNGDGKPDVLVLNQTNTEYGDGAVGVLIGNGNGTLQSVKTYDSGGYAASSFAIADLNHDGRLDLVVVNCGPAGTTQCSSNNGSVAVLLGNGNGTFRTAQTFNRGGGGGSSDPVAVADLNGDGIPDIVVGNSCIIEKNGRCGYGSDGSIGILIGKGDGTFKPVVHYDSGGGGSSSLTVVDVNGDGIPDVVVGSVGVGVLRGKGDGTFWLVDRYFTDGGAAMVLVADVNGDGKPDLIVPNGTSSDIAVLLGNGSGFSGPTIFSSGGFIVSYLAVSDLNGDGRPDLLSANWCADEATCVVGQAEVGTLGVLLNNPAFVYGGTTTTLASSANPAPPNQAVTYTATVTNPAGGPVTGTVSFTEGSKLVGQVNVANNQAAVTLQGQKQGTYGLQAAYSGDANNVGSASLTLDEYIKVLPVTSKTILTTSGSPSHVGQAVTFTATVSSQFGAIPNGEQVTFYEGKTALGTGTTANGVASLTTSFSQAKTYVIKATYSGDNSFEPSSGMVKQSVNNALDSNVAAPDPLGNSSAVADAQNAEKAKPAAYNSPCPSKTKFYEVDGGPYITEPFTLGATANMNEYCNNVYHVICSGEMLFYVWDDGGWNALGAGKYGGQCAWQLQTTALPVGTHRLKAIYTGDEDGFSPSSALNSVDVEKWPTGTILGATPNPSLHEEDVTLTAIVTHNQNAPAPPTGKIKFTLGAETLGMADVNSNGIATFTTNRLPPGIDSITADYSGDSANASSTSAVWSQVVNP